MYNSDAQKICGFCGETVPAGVGRCPYCGSLLEVTFDKGYGSGEPVNQSAGQFPGEPAGMNREPAGMNNESVGMNGWHDAEQNAGVRYDTGNADNTGNTDNTGNADNTGNIRNHEAALDQGRPQTPGNPENQPQNPAPQGWSRPQQGTQSQWQNPERPIQDYQRPYYQNRPQQAPRYDKPALSNGLKVFLTILFTVIPGIGQLAGIITAIVFMSAEGDKDRKSFGVALLVACLILFLLSCIGCFALSLFTTQLPFNYGNNW